MSLGDERLGIMQMKIYGYAQIFISDLDKYLQELNETDCTLHTVVFDTSNNVVHIIIEANDGHD